VSKYTKIAISVIVVAIITVIIYGFSFDQNITNLDRNPNNKLSLEDAIISIPETISTDKFTISNFTFSIETPKDSP